MSTLREELNSGAVGIGLNRRALAEIERLTTAGEDLLKRGADKDRKIHALLEALKEIAKGRGAYSLDPLAHASNVIEDMKALATDAIEKHA